MNRELESPLMTTELSFFPLHENHLTLHSYAQYIYALRFFDPDVFAQSFGQSIPVFVVHCIHLKRHIVCDPFYFVLTRGKRFVGYISGRYEASGIELSLAIQKHERGKGVGLQAIEYVINNYHRPMIWYAKIKPGNTASVKCFQKAGFHLIYESEGLIIMRKETK